MTTPASKSRQIKSLRQVILNSRPGSSEWLTAVDEAIHAALAAPDNGLSLREIEDLCDAADNSA